MTLDFIYDARSPRVVFGEGALDRLAAEVERLGASRVLLLCTPRRGAAVERAAQLLGPRLGGIFDRARMHVPSALVDEAVTYAARLATDCCLSIGGGSAIGLGKALARAGDLPLVAVPTTYSGSEATPIWGTSAGGRKTTGRDPRALPRTVLYDPLLTLDLPARVAGPSGMNAVAHCVEALYAPDANPVTSLLAEEGLRVLSRSLPVVVRAPGDRAARADALYGAWLAGSALGSVAMGLHHRLCHALGGRFDLPHAETHAVVLPHAVAYNRSAAAGAMARIADALGAAMEDVAGAVYDLGVAVGAPTSLRDLGLAEERLDEAAAAAVEQGYPNPRPVTRDDVRALLEDAYHGRRPERRSDGRHSIS